jgi:hypothetical protein
MSEYQYYEWQTLERSLTAAEQKAVNGLSSHIDVSSSQAIVTYDWGDFKHDPLDVLAKYFDAHLYFANWGSRCLAFRFPTGLLDVDAVEPYCDEDHTNISSIGAFQILAIELNEEEGFDEWIDERGLLSTLARLRDDILQGDYRVLYLAWLKAMSLETGDEDEDDSDSLLNDHEPPVPAGLKQLSPPLQTFIDFFDVNPFLVSAAAELSPDLSPARQTNFATLIPYLSRQECDEFLLKIVNAEPGAIAVLRKKLLAFEKPKSETKNKLRTFGELLKTAKHLRQAESKRQSEAKRKKHIDEMQKLSQREAEIWQDVENVLESGYTARNYDDATALLDKLQQLAEFQGTQAGFSLRLQILVKKYKARSALMSRWKKNGWI